MEEILEEVRRWIRKADDDLTVAKEMLNFQKRIPWVICFHAQQAVEKYLKAFLIFQQIDFRKTHDTSELLNLCIQADQNLEKLQNLKIEKLTYYTVESRYPGFYEPDLEDAKEALLIAENVRELVLKRLGFL